LRDRGRDSLVTFLERAARWRTLCYPASGAGRKGIRRPDLLAAQPAGPRTWRRFCVECKWPGRFPIYIDAAQVEALRDQAELWGATPWDLISSGKNSSPQTEQRFFWTSDSC